MKEMVTKVSIKVSDDGGKCDVGCRFLYLLKPDFCAAFNVKIENMERCSQCFAREDATYQIVGE